MNTQLSHQLSYDDLARISPDVVIADEIARHQHQRVRPVGVRPLPSEPFYENGWWFERGNESIIPYGCKELLWDFKKGGLTWQGIVIGHETPKNLPAPASIARTPVPYPVEKPKNITLPKLPMKEIATGVALGAVGLAVAPVAAVGLLMLPFMLLPLALVDPSVSIVLSGSNIWLEVWTWYE